MTGDPRYPPWEAWELLRLAAQYVYPADHPQAAPLPVGGLRRIISDQLRDLAAANAEHWPAIQPVISTAAGIIEPLHPEPATPETRRAIGDGLAAIADSYETGVRAREIIRREFPEEEGQ